MGTDEPEMAVRVRLERGRVLNSSGSPADARPLFESAFSRATALGFEHLALDALHMIAIVAPPSESLTLNEEALMLASNAADPRARDWRASLLNNLGWGRFEAGEFDGALALFTDAVTERERMGKMPELQVARWCVGRTLRALGRVEEALAMQRAPADEHAAAGTTDSYVDEEIAACLAELAASGSQSNTTPEPGTA